METHVHIKKYTLLFMAALFVIANTENYPNVLQWVNSRIYIQWNTAIKIKLFIHRTIWIDLNDTMLSERKINLKILYTV